MRADRGGVAVCHAPVRNACAIRRHDNATAARSRDRTADHAGAADRHAGERATISDPDARGRDGDRAANSIRGSADVERATRHGGAVADPSAGADDHRAPADPGSDADVDGHAKSSGTPGRE